MTSWKNRVTAAIATAAIAASMLPVSALGLTADSTIKVTGIDSGDSAAYYQVIQQNASTKAWELKAPFTGLNLKDLPGNAEKAAANPTWTDIDYILDGINAEEVGVIASKAGTKTGDLIEDSTTAGAYIADVNPGMYLVLVTPKNDNKDVVYKPIIVAADYDQSDQSKNQVDLPADLATAVAKKSPLTLTKTAKQVDDPGDEDARGVAVGDTVEFTVKTSMPSYTSNFTKPVFKIKDELTAGLKLTGETDITVSVANNTVAKDTDYKITGVSDTGYTVEFQPAFLYKVTGAPEVTITYKATITSDAAKQVNEMDNTVKLNFSNTPTDTTGQGELTDKTRHYTFDIDADVYGGSWSDGSGQVTGKTKEIEKVWIESNGTETKTVKESDYPGSLNPLEGAKFELRTDAGDAATALTFTDGKYDRTATNKVLTSASDGSITIKGLDEGTYYLIETEAPAGYSIDTTPLTIKISATYVPGADGNDVLESYEVDVNGNKSIYNVGKNGTYPIELTAAGATVDHNVDNVTTLITNKKLGILPSTGGSGIYFYLVLGGAIAGVSAYYIQKTKKQEELLAQ